MEISIPRESNRPEYDRMTICMRGKDGLPIKKYSDNLILGTHMYEVKYPDEHKASLYANATEENMFPKLMFRTLDMPYLRTSLIPQIMDQEVKKYGNFITAPNGNKQQRDTTKSLGILVQWKDRISTWISLNYMNNSYPVHYSYYANLEIHCCWSIIFMVDSTCADKTKSNYWEYQY